MNLLELLARRLPLNQSELNLLIMTAPNRYKIHTIDKRHNRGKRIIAQPTAEVKAIQSITQSILSEQLPIHQSAKAYRQGVSIKDHALPHAKNRYLLKIDFKDFFPSILGTDFKKHLKRHSNIDNATICLLESILFWRPRGESKLRLSIGAPSSPWVSNTILFEFDSLLSQYCTINSIEYTRYADDLALSTNTPNILKDALDHVVRICNQLNYPSLIINPEKTIFTSKKHSRRLTGLVLSNEGTVSIGRDKKRNIRAKAHAHSQGKLAPEDITTLRGLLAYTYSIDKDFNKSIERMIGQEKYAMLMNSKK